MPQQNIIHIDQALSNLSIAYTNEDYIWDKIMPTVPVEKRSDKYFVYGKEHLRYRESRVRPGGVADELEYTLSTSSYLAELRARRHLVLDEEVQIADSPLSPQIDATEALTENMWLTREYDIGAYVTNNANLTNYTALSSTSKWDDYANSTPLTNFKTAKVSVRLNALKRANMIMLPYEVALNLADHPSIKDLIKYTDPNALTESGLPPVIRGLRVLEPAAAYDSSIEGRTFSSATIWGKNAIIAYITPSAGRKVVSMGYTFEAPDATTGARGISTRVYRDEERRGDWVEVMTTYDFRVISVGAAYLYQTVVS